MYEVMIDGGAGTGFSIIVISASEAFMPRESVTVTLYIPGVETTIDCVVCPPGDDK
jgi:hypothetical protein